MSNHRLKTVAILTVLLLATRCVIAKCYFPGPYYPVPTITDDNTYFRQVAKELDKTLARNHLNVENATLSVEVTSTHDSLWSFHRKSQQAAKGSAETIGRDTSYRIASVTKAFTVLVAIHLQKQGKLDFDAPISDYIDELKGSSSGPRWERITLRALAGQLSGLQRESYRSCKMESLISVD